VSESDQVPRTLRLANQISSASDVAVLQDVLQTVSKADVAVSQEVRTSLVLRSSDIVCLIRRSRLEGRAPPNLDWIVAWQEFLLENCVQDEMRRNGAVPDMLTAFIDVLNSMKTSEVEQREALRALGTIPILSDTAWREAYQSPLKGLVQKITGTEDLPRLLTLVLRVATLIQNRGVLEAINARATEIVPAITGRKNPELAEHLLGAITTLDGNPWRTERSQFRVEMQDFDSRVSDAVLGHFSRTLPKKSRIVGSDGSQNHIGIKEVERCIQRIGWVFTRQYMQYLAEINETLSTDLYSVSMVQDPLGAIKEEYLLFCIREGIPVPYTILQSSIGKASEYILDIEVLESEKQSHVFPADCRDMSHLLRPSDIRERHLINCRTGIRLDEAYHHMGDRSIVRVLMDRNEDVTRDIVVNFLTSLLLATTIPLSIKKRASDSLKHLEDK
jgi:hypothetical protein